MFRLLVHVRRSTLPVLIVLCLAALTVSYAFAQTEARPLATQIIGDPDAAVTGKLAVGTATPGNKALTIVGVIDFLGSGSVHNYFTQGAGNNMQINTNVDEVNNVGDGTKSQWKLVMGSSLDWFSIRRSPAWGLYNEDALFFIEGSTGNVGIAKVDTGNLAAIPFTPAARLHVQTDSGRAIYGRATATAPENYGVYGESNSWTGYGVYGRASATCCTNYGLYGQSDSTEGYGVVGVATATTGYNYGVFGESDSFWGYGVVGLATAIHDGTTWGVYGESAANTGYGVYGLATASSTSDLLNRAVGVYGESRAYSGAGVYAYASNTVGNSAALYARSESGYAIYAVSYRGAGVSVYAPMSSGISAEGTTGVIAYGNAGNGYGVKGVAASEAGTNAGVYGQSRSTSGYGVYGEAYASTGTNFGIYGMANSPDGYGVYSDGNLYAAGDFTATGTKAAIVDTEEYGWRNLYAMESPQNWFEDFGRGTLSAGEAVVSIEPIFAQTVNLDEDYHVFLTPLGPCGLYVAEKSRSTFTVRTLDGSACEIAFDYRIIAPRLNYEDLRLKEVEGPQAVSAPALSVPPASAVSSAPVALPTTVPAPRLTVPLD